MLYAERPIPGYTHGRMVADLVRGAHDGLRGAAYLARNPRLWIWVVLPAVIIGLVLFAALGAILAVVSPWIAAVVAFVPGHWAERLIEVVAWIILAIASMSLVLSLAALIAGPFNEMLSEAIEERITGVPGPKFKLGHFLYDALVGAIHALRRITVYLILMGLLLLIGLLVPVVGTAVAAAGGAIATARFASYDAYDAVYARRRMPYREKMAALNARLSRSMGLGAIVSAVLLVPGLNLLALSIGAAGATLASVTPPAQPTTKSSRASQA
jgi:CysZ protein